MVRLEIQDWCKSASLFVSPLLPFSLFLRSKRVVLVHNNLRPDRKLGDKTYIKEFASSPHHGLYVGRESPPNRRVPLVFYPARPIGPPGRDDQVLRVSRHGAAEVSLAVYVQARGHRGARACRVGTRRDHGEGCGRRMRLERRPLRCRGGSKDARGGMMQTCKPHGRHHSRKG